MDLKQAFLGYYEPTMPAKVRTVAKRASRPILGQNRLFQGKNGLKWTGWRVLCGFLHARLALTLLQYGSQFFWTLK